MGDKFIGTKICRMCEKSKEINVDIGLLFSHCIDCNKIMDSYGVNKNQKRSFVLGFRYGKEVSKKRLKHE